MNKIRDIIYNVSDILVTLLIIIAALILISWRVSAIMHYGTPDDTGSGTQVEETDGSSDAESNDSDSQTKAPSGTVSANQSAQAIGQALASAGLVTDSQTFINAVNAAGAATRLKVGSFTIPAGSTPEQIVVILTS